MHWPRRQKVKSQGHTVTKTVTVARLLVTRVATAVCYGSRRGSACRYDCLCSLVTCIAVLCGGVWYTRLHHFQGDIIAGITVGLTVVPQSLAYANIAELPPQVCSYASTVFDVYVLSVLTSMSRITKMLPAWILDRCHTCNFIAQLYRATKSQVWRGVWRATSQQSRNSFSD